MFKLLHSNRSKYYPSTIKNSLTDLIAKYAKFACIGWLFDVPFLDADWSLRPAGLGLLQRCRNYDYKLSHFTVYVDLL